MRLSECFALMCCALAISPTGSAMACAGPGPVISFEQGAAQVPQRGREQLQNLALWASGNLEGIEAIWVVIPSAGIDQDGSSKKVAFDRAATVARLLTAYGIPESLIKTVSGRQSDTSAVKGADEPPSRLEVGVELKADGEVSPAVSPGVYLAC